MQCLPRHWVRTVPKVPAICDSFRAGNVSLAAYLLIVLRLRRTCGERGWEDQIRRQSRERERVAMSCMLIASRPPFLSLPLSVSLPSVLPLSRLDLSLSLSESVSSRHDFNFAPHCAKVSRIACSRDAMPSRSPREKRGWGQEQEARQRGVT